MEETNYTELDWRRAIVLGVALRDGLLDAVADECRSVGEVARQLGLDPRAVNMLVLTAGGGPYTREEYEAWLARAGFEGVDFVPVPGRGTHLVFARNPG